MTELSLFTGSGGGLLASALLGWHPIGYVEWTPHCQLTLSQRMLDGLIPTAPIFTDIRLFNSQGYAGAYSGLVDVITGGFPCQPFSVAGKQSGPADVRNMWPATVETIRIVGPRYVFLENVPNLRSGRHGYFGTVLSDLASCGYRVRWRVLSAADVGALHLRKRLWIYGERG